MKLIGFRKFRGVKFNMKYKHDIVFNKVYKDINEEDLNLCLTNDTVESGKELFISRYKNSFTPIEFILWLKSVQVDVNIGVDSEHNMIIDESSIKISPYEIMILAKHLRGEDFSNMVKKIFFITKDLYF